MTTLAPPPRCDDFKNPTDIAVGATVYVGRRGLEAKHYSLMKPERYIVVKRTPQGYRLRSPRSSNFESNFQDSRYYISTDEVEVVFEMRCDLDQAEADLYWLIDKLREANVTLSDLYYGVTSTQ